MTILMILTPKGLTAGPIMSKNSTIYKAVRGSKSKVFQCEHNILLKSIFNKKTICLFAHNFIFVFFPPARLKNYPIYSKFLKLGSKYCIDIDNSYELDLLGLKCWPNYDLKMFEKLRKCNHLQGSTSNGKVFQDCQSKYNTSFFQTINFSVLLSPKRFKNYPHLLKLTKSWFKILY